MDPGSILAGLGAACAGTAALLNWKTHRSLNGHPTKEGLGKMVWETRNLLVSHIGDPNAHPSMRAEHFDEHGPR